jgi:hypothetical protein
MRAFHVAADEASSSDELQITLAPPVGTVRVADKTDNVEISLTKPGSLSGL